MKRYYICKEDCNFAKKGEVVYVKKSKYEDDRNLIYSFYKNNVLIGNLFTDVVQNFFIELKDAICIKGFWYYGGYKEMNEGDVVQVKYDQFTNEFDIFKHGELEARLTCDEFRMFFKPCYEEECTVTKLDDQQPTKNTYKGWQIIKMISEGEIKEGTIIENIEEEYTFTYEKGSYFMDLNDLIAGEFKILKQVELISFREALERNINIKHKDWKIESTTPQNVLNHYAKIESAEILQDLFSDAKVWEVEND